MMCHETGTICYGLMVTLEKLQGSYCCYSYKGVYFRRCCCFLLLFFCIFHINLKELHALVSALLDCLLDCFIQPNDSVLE